jgi:DNA-binding NarL/FixJ family response regulator
VILDLMMPHLDGAHCLREIRAIDPQARVLMASGFPTGGTVQALLAAGAAGFIQKPFRHDQLRQAVAEAMAQDKKPEPKPPA